MKLPTSLPQTPLLVNNIAEFDRFTRFLRQNHVSYSARQVKIDKKPHFAIDLPAQWKEDREKSRVGEILRMLTE